jgi:hypothetical protein
MQDRIAVFVHMTSQSIAEPVMESVVHAMLSSQLVGQFPSHVSVGSTAPLPQTSPQSPSLSALQPGGQQPSPSAHTVIGWLVHATSQVAASPVRASVVQTSLSSQLAGQVVSQSSGGSTTVFPHRGAQSASVLALHTAGQQPSDSSEQTVMARFVHWASQFEALPISRSVVHTIPSSQSASQTKFGSSQVSPTSMLPFPQVAEQSLSVPIEHAGGQQPSPSMHAVMGAEYMHTALHVLAEPTSVSLVHASRSSHVAGQFPSHSSLGSIVRFPQSAMQSLSVASSQPIGQHPSSSAQDTIGL